jgi:sugar phosphate isomerase/epimerase
VALDHRDLILCSGTLQGVGVRALCAAAVAGDFRGITLWPQDVAAARDEGISLAQLRALVDDHGLVVADLDPLLRWLPGEEIPAGMPAAGEEEFYEIADATGARSLNVAQGFGRHADVDRAAEGLAGVCQRAAPHGLLITLEYLPWSGIPDAAKALAIVEKSGAENATIMVDIWHSFRGPTDTAQLQALPAARVGSVQINDAPAQPLDDLVFETLNARLLPGEGDAPIVEWIRLLDAIGSVAPIGVEVFSSELARLPPEEVGRRCGHTARRTLATARSEPTTRDSGGSLRSRLAPRG